MTTVAEEMYVSARQVTGSIPQTRSPQDFFENFSRRHQVSEQAGLKYRTHIINLVARLVVVTKEPSSTPQHVKGVVHVVC